MINKEETKIMLNNSLECELNNFKEENKELYNSISNTVCELIDNIYNKNSQSFQINFDKLINQSIVIETFKKNIEIKKQKINNYFK